MLYTSNIADLAEAIRDYVSIKSQREPLESILLDQAAKLSCSDFGGGNRGLYQEARAISPTKDQLTALPASLGWRIKRPKGWNVFASFETYTVSRGRTKGQQRTRRAAQSLPGEIEKRIRGIGYQASGWLSVRLNEYAKLKRGDRAIVFISTTGNEISVIIRNQSTQAAEVAERTGYLQRAINNREKDLLEYVNRHLDELADHFNAAQIAPAITSSQTASSQLDQLLRVA